MEEKGTIYKVMPVQSGTSARTGKEWRRQQFVVEFENMREHTIRRVAFTTSFDRALAALEGMTEGTPVKVTYNVTSREWNDRWYTDAEAFSVEPLTPAQTAPEKVDYPVSEDLPF